MKTLIVIALVLTANRKTLWNNLNRNLNKDA